MSITSKYVLSADGTRLFAQAAGNPANPAIVCAHGFGGTSFAFRKQLANPRLLDHVYVIAYDLRGNGRSDMPEEPAAYAGKKMAEDFQAVSTAFGVTRPILLGWSLGGASCPPSFSSQLTRTDPQRCSSSTSSTPSHPPTCAARSSLAGLS